MKSNCYVVVATFCPLLHSLAHLITTMTGFSATSVTVKIYLNKRKTCWAPLFWMGRTMITGLPFLTRLPRDAIREHFDPLATVQAFFLLRLLNNHLAGQLFSSRRPEAVFM